jgi:type I restriction enzyme M protein
MRNGGVAKDSDVRLGDLIGLAGTGRTPARAAYTPAGLFTVKVGNLTGQGIDWAPRERNFIAPGKTSEKYLLKAGDILLTSSAHNPKYIAQKVDIVGEIPQFAGSNATFVGEVMRLRPADGVDPYVLLAILRHPRVRSQLQEIVTGQTGHLRPGDIMDVLVPAASPPVRLIEALKEETRLAEKRNLAWYEASTAMQTWDQQGCLLQS